MGINEFLFLLAGLKWTVALSAIGFLGGGVFGLAIALTRTSGIPWVERITAGYIAIFQGTPLLMQLFVVYYGLALIGLKLDAWVAVAIGFTCMPAPISARSGAARSRPSRRGRPRPPRR
jgi:polar amino acid transport system permease protein